MKFDLSEEIHTGRKILIPENITNLNLCYELKSNEEIKLIRNEVILLKNGLSIIVDENGAILSNDNHVQNEKLYSKEQILEIIRPLLANIENEFKNLDNRLSENNENETYKVEKLLVDNRTIITKEKKIKDMEKKNGKLNILVTAICFVNRNKPGAEIYATFANRLLNDVMTKTPYDFRIITNEISHFEENKNFWGDRVIVTQDSLEGEKLTVGPFNQLLKYKTMLGVDKKYDWVLYLDCDAGLTGEINVDELEKQTEIWESEGYDFMATRTNAILKHELENHELREKEFYENNPEGNFNPWIHGGNLFSAKFIFYNVSSENGPYEWMDAKLPSEHVWYMKNDEKLEKMGIFFKKFNEKFETQTSENLITWDMEAFEVGVSAQLAGYNMGELGNDGQFHILKIGFNFNNWEKVKY